MSTENFVACSKTKQYLQDQSVEFNYRTIHMDDLEEDWRRNNAGREDGKSVEQPSVEAYGELMINGSKAPAVVVRMNEEGKYSVMDGVQRLIANENTGEFTASAYIVACSLKAYKRLRIAFNLAMCPEVVPDFEWGLGRLIQENIIDGQDTVETIAALTRTKRSRVMNELLFVQTKNVIDSIYQSKGLDPPAFKRTFYIETGKVWPHDDIDQAKRHLKRLFDTFVSCKMHSGQNGVCVEIMRGIYPKKAKAKDFITQVGSKVNSDSGLKHPQLLNYERLASAPGKVSTFRLIVQHANNLEKNARKHKLTGTKMDDSALIESLDTTLKEACRLLREQVTTRLRNQLDPFNYR